MGAEEKTNNKTIFVEYFEREIVIDTGLHAFRRRCYSRIQTRIEPAGATGRNTIGRQFVLSYGPLNDLSLS